MRSHKFYCLFVGVIAISTLVFAADLPPCTQIEVIYGDPPVMEAFLGNAVATTQLDSNRVLFVAGAHQYGNSSEGAAFVYARDNFGDTQFAKSYPFVTLQNPDPTVNGHFGEAVAITKYSILIGHPTQSSVYVYSTQDYTLIQTLKYTGLFGSEIAVYGDSLMAISAPADNLVYIFEYANSWKLQAMVTDDEAPSDANFGISIALDDLVLAVGASGNNTAYVFERNGTEWNEIAHLRPTGEISSNVLVFGSSIAVIPGIHTVIVGNYLEPSATTADKKDAGALYFFERSQTGNVVSYSQVQRMVEVNSSRFDHFGESLFVIDQHLVLAGAHKRAEEFTEEGVVYTLTNTNGTWIQSTRIKPTDPSAYSWFGWSMAVYKNSWEYILVVGSSYDTTKIYDGGAIRLFSCPFGSPPRESSKDGGNSNRGVNIAVGVVVAVVALAAIGAAAYFVWRRTNKGYTKSEL